MFPFNATSDSSNLLLPLPASAEAVACGFARWSHRRESLAARTTSILPRLAIGLLVAAAFLAPAARSVADESNVPLDALLTQAMDKNPGVVALKAKVALAEAELRSTRLEVARQLIALRSDQRAQARAVESARVELKRAQQISQAQPGAFPIKDLEAAKSNVIDAEARLARTDVELRFLLGQLPPGVSPAIAQSAPAQPVQVPRGPIPDAIRKALDVTATLEFEKAPMQAVFDFIEKTGKINVTIDSTFVGDIVPLTLQVKEAPLSAGLQAIEDILPGLQFVVRDYGLLFTTHERVEEQGFLTLAEFVRQSGSREPDATAKPAVSAPK